MRERLSRRGLLVASAGSVLLAGCRKKNLGLEDVPPGTKLDAGSYRDLSPRWSHDGQSIAFLRLTTDRRYQLYIATSDLQQVTPVLEPFLVNPDRPLRPGRSWYVAPEDIAWSDDDGRIAFPRVTWFTFDTGERLPGTDLWSFDRVSRTTPPLAMHPRKYEKEFYYFRTPVWSPDGKRLAAMAEAPDGATGLILRDLSAADVEIAVPRADAYDDTDWPAWSPDGRRLVFRQGILREPTADAVETLRYVEPGGQNAESLITLTVSEASSLFSESRYGKDGTTTPRFASPAWSPDGTRIALSITPAARDLPSYALFILDAARPAALRRISPRDGRGYLAPVWIDQDRVGAIRTAAHGWEVVLLSASGTGRARLLGTLPTDDFDWSPDRKRIVCSTATQVQPRGRETSTLRVLPTVL